MLFQNDRLAANPLSTLQVVTDAVQNILFFQQRVAPLEVLGRVVLRIPSPSCLFIVQSSLRDLQFFFNLCQLACQVQAVHRGQQLTFPGSLSFFDDKCQGQARER